MPESNTPALSPEAVQKMLARMRQLGDGTLKIPPPVFDDMDCEVTRFTPGEALCIRVPVRERYQNPMGMMQGGVIAAAMDNALGPLSYLVAPPSVTTQLSITYLRPVTPETEHVEVEARFVERSGRQLLLEAVVRLPDGQTAARGQAACVIPRSSS